MNYLSALESTIKLFKAGWHRDTYFSAIAKDLIDPYSPYEPKRRGRYMEKHHILPRCMNGGNEKINLVYLTAREHFIVHKLLVEMVSDPLLKVKLKYAVGKFMLARAAVTGRVYTEVQFTQMREALSSACSERFKGKKLSEDKKLQMKICRYTEVEPVNCESCSKLFYAKTKRRKTQGCSPECSNVILRKTQSKNSLGRKFENRIGHSHTEESRRKISEANKNKIVSDETKKKLSEAKTGKPSGRLGVSLLTNVGKKQPIVSCPHCGMSGGSFNMNRYHFDKCKKRDGISTIPLVCD